MYMKKIWKDQAEKQRQYRLRKKLQREAKFKEMEKQIEEKRKQEPYNPVIDLEKQQQSLPQETKPIGNPLCYLNQDCLNHNHVCQLGEKYTLCRYYLYKSPKPESNTGLTSKCFKEQSEQERQFYEGLRKGK